MTELSSEEKKLHQENLLKKAIKEFLDKNIWIDEDGTIFSQWKEEIAFEMSDETRKIITDIYYEPTTEIVPPKPVKR